MSTDERGPGGPSRASVSTGGGAERNAVGSAFPSGGAPLAGRAACPLARGGTDGRGALPAARGAAPGALGLPPAKTRGAATGAAAAGAATRDVEPGESRTGGGTTGGAVPSGKPGGCADWGAAATGRTVAAGLGAARGLSLLKRSSRRAIASSSATLSRWTSSSGMGGCMVRSWPSRAFRARS